MVRNIASTVLVFAVAFLIGFRPSAGPLDWLAAVGILVVFILAISWLSAAFGLLARSPEAAGGSASWSCSCPIRAAPSSHRDHARLAPGFASNQPVTPVIETLRGLLLTPP